MSEFAFDKDIKTARIALGIVLRRSPGATRWARWAWRAVGVMPGAGPADWRVLREAGGVTDYPAATLTLELHRADTEAYIEALSTNPPCVYIVLEPDEDSPEPGLIRPLLATASPYEAQDYLDADALVERAPMPPGLKAWIEAFVETHHVEEAFIKRQRDKRIFGADQDGIGDARIRQQADVYRSPQSLRRAREAPPKPRRGRLH